MSEAREFKYVGQRSIRPDGFDKVTGRANYGADLSLPGMIWGKILRSPHAHARIKKLDLSKAEAHPGVMAVATYQDFPSVSHEAFQAGEGATDLLDLARNIMADGKVLYDGHAICAVAARTEAIAEEALALIAQGVQVPPRAPGLGLAAAAQPELAAHGQVEQRRRGGWGAEQVERLAGMRAVGTVEHRGERRDGGLAFADEGLDERRMGGVHLAGQIVEDRVAGGGRAHEAWSWLTAKPARVA